MIISYTVPEIQRVTDVISIFILGYFLPFYPLKTQKNKILKQWKKHLEMPSSYIFVPKFNTMYGS